MHLVLKLALIVIVIMHLVLKVKIIWFSRGTEEKKRDLIIPPSRNTTANALYKSL